MSSVATPLLQLYSQHAPALTEIGEKSEVQKLTTKDKDEGFGPGEREKGGGGTVQPR
jgi:hypothetical protein